MTTKSMSVSTSLQHPWFGNRNDYEIYATVLLLLHTKMAGLLDGDGGASCHLFTATDSQIMRLEWFSCGFPTNRLITLGNKKIFFLLAQIVGAFLGYIGVAKCENALSFTELARVFEITSHNCKITKISKFFSP